MNHTPSDPIERRNLIRRLKDHPIWEHPQHKLGCFSDLVWINLTYVNPADDIVADNDSLNTKPEVWIEAGPYVDTSEWNSPGIDRWMKSHDYRLDCGGNTLEEALCNLSSLVHKYYTDEGAGRATSDEQDNV